MPGQKAKFAGDPSIKYQVKRVDSSLNIGKKGRSVIIRTDLEYDAAVAITKTFNVQEELSQVRKDEAARENAL
jgi:hypothetical protein